MKDHLESDRRIGRESRTASQAFVHRDGVVKIKLRGGLIFYRCKRAASFGIWRILPLMLLPPTATSDAARLVIARALRGFVDGFVSVYLALHLQLLGFSAIQIGAIVTAMLVGSAVLTLVAGLFAHRLSSYRVLLIATALMAGTGAGFALLTNFWLLLIVAFVGTLNPSAGDVSVFLPAEQSILVDEVAPVDRTALFARY